MFFDLKNLRTGELVGLSVARRVYWLKKELLDCTWNSRVVKRVS